jgi:branched-chain amino acid transport system substrate-binding protein
MRVTFVRPDSATGIGFEDGLLARLRYNGLSLADNHELFQEIVFDESAADPAAGVADKIVAFRPHVIIYPGDSITARLPEAVERQWRGAERPRYVFGTPLQDEALKRLVEARPDLAPRVLGISLPAATIQNVKLAAHYSQAFGAEQTATTTTPNAYDAVYLLAYAAMAAGEDTLTGKGLARGIERLLPPGEALDVGPARILEGFSALRAGKRIDLTGASGPLDFDTTTGDAQFDYVFECFALARGHARRTETELRWDLRTQKLVGASTCR